MTLGEKITMLRKEKHWSQEELAMRLDISRQSVSKWESEASVPDLDKVVRLSEIFDVSLDFLLKEDADFYRKDSQEGNGSSGEFGEAGTQKEAEEVPRRVEQEEAEDYIELVKYGFRRIALGVSLCILSPITVILLSGLAEEGALPLTEDQAAGIGLTVLFLLVCAAVVLFILNGMALDKYEWLEKEQVLLTDDCRAELERNKEEFEPTFRGCIAAGVALCILSMIPLFLAGAFAAGEAVYLFALGFLLFVIAAGVYPLIWAAGIWSGYEQLLQVGDYTPDKKRKNKRSESISGVYWGIVTTIYLGISFYTMSWHRTWIIWPCAGVLFVTISGLLELRQEKGRANG